MAEGQTERIMDWIKIKTSHYAYTNLSLNEIGCLLLAQIMTATLERVPTDLEMRSRLPQATLRSLAGKLQDSCTSLAEVLQKVCNDVARVTEKRCKDVARLHNYRHNAKNTIGETHINDPVDKIRVDKRREEKSKRHRNFVAPTLIDVKAYQTEIGKGTDPQRFIDFYASKGWMVGRAPMKDWKAAYRRSAQWDGGEETPAQIAEKKRKADEWARIKKGIDQRERELA
jgi:hypothetical protein